MAEEMAMPLPPSLEENQTWRPSLPRASRLGWEWPTNYWEVRATDSRWKLLLQTIFFASMGGVCVCVCVCVCDGGGGRGYLGAPVKIPLAID
jgi:hypothetical protein